MVYIETAVGFNHNSSFCAGSTAIVIRTCYPNKRSFFVPKYTLDQLRKLEDIESRLATLRKEYPTAYKSRQDTLELMARSLKKAAELVTGRPYQKPLDTATAVPS